MNGFVAPCGGKHRNFEIRIVLIKIGRTLRRKSISKGKGPKGTYLLQFLLDGSGPDDERATDGVLHQLDGRIDVVQRDALLVSAR